MNVKCGVSTALGPGLWLEFAIALEFRWDFRAGQGNTSSLLFFNQATCQRQCANLDQESVIMSSSRHYFKNRLAKYLGGCTLGQGFFFIWSGKIIYLHISVKTKLYLCLNSYKHFLASFKVSIKVAQNNSSQASF